MARRTRTPPYATKVLGLSLPLVHECDSYDVRFPHLPRQVDMLNGPLPIMAAFRPGFLIESHDRRRMSAGLGSVALSQSDVSDPTHGARPGLQIGIDSFAAAYDDTSLAVDPSERLQNLVEQIEYADQVGLDS